MRMSMPEVVDFLTEFRKERKISLTNVALKMNTSHSHMWRIENKLQNSDPRFETLERWVKALSILSGEKVTIKLDIEVTSGRG